MKRSVQGLTVLLIVLGLGMILPVQAQMDPNAMVSRIMHVYRDNTAHWESTLRGYALGLFWALAGIEFTWSCIKLALKNADLSEFLAELVNRVLYIGFFLALLLHSSEWANAIVQSFRMAADAANSGHGLSPGNVLEVALQIVQKLYNHSTIMNPVDMLVSALCGLSILICFGLMAANMIEALIESYVVISAGVLMMGFGGSGWTNEFAEKMMLYAVSVGAKLFLIQLIMGLGEHLIEQLGAEFDGSRIEDALVMVGVAVIMWMISFNVPNKLQGLLNGSSLSQGGFLAGAISSGVAAGVGMAMGSLTTGTKALAGGVSTALGATELTHEQFQGKEKPSAWQWMGQAGKNVAQAATSNLGQRFRGEIWHGHMGAQMGHAMSEQSKALKSLREETNEQSQENNKHRDQKPDVPHLNQIIPGEEINSDAD